MSAWDYCNLDEEQLGCIEEVKHVYDAAIASPTAQSNPSSTSSSNNDILEALTGSEYDAYMSLREIEASCREFLSQIDEALKLLENISVAYDDVTSRTNVLMVNCEALLEQQVECI